MIDVIVMLVLFGVCAAVLSALVLVQVVHEVVSGIIKRVMW